MWIHSPGPIHSPQPSGALKLPALPAPRVALASPLQTRGPTRAPAVRSVAWAVSGMAASATDLAATTHPPASLIRALTLSICSSRSSTEPTHSIPFHATRSRAFLGRLTACLRRALRRPVLPLISLRAVRLVRLLRMVYAPPGVERPFLDTFDVSQSLQLHARLLTSSAQMLSQPSLCRLSDYPAAVSATDEAPLPLTILQARGKLRALTRLESWLHPPPVSAVSACLA